MNFDYPRFTAAVKSRRTADGLTLRQLSDITHVSPSTISRIENGADYDIQMRTFLGLCEWMGAAPATFLGEADEVDNGVDYIAGLVIHCAAIPARRELASYLLALKWDATYGHYE